MEIQNKAKSKTEELLNKLGIVGEFTIETEMKEEADSKKYLWVIIKGEDVSEIIGYHGKVLESLQTIIALFLDEDLKKEECGVIIEVNSYREDRAKYIESVAKRAIMEVQELKQDMELTPMKSFERRVVHMVAKADGLETESVGNGEERRVIIKYVQKN